MKKFLLCAAVILIAIAMTSFQRGYGAARGEGLTKAPGESGSTCGQSGCHSSGAFSPSLDVSLTDSEGNQVEQYFPGETYTVSLKINHTGLPNGYGFQMVCLNNDENLPINNFSDFPQDVGAVTIGDRQYVEQNKRLPVDSIFMTWTAPEQETGDVTFYVSANASNANGGSSGDGAADGSFTFAEALGLSTSNIQVQELNVFPNPTTGTINIPNNIQVSTLDVMDMNGQILKSSKEGTINISDVPTGSYLIKVIDMDQKAYSKVIQKK